MLLIFRGHERIRTAVTGFADRGLATRPRDHIKDCKSKKYLFIKEVFIPFCVKYDKWII
jgi:hypothetical protein